MSKQTINLGTAPTGVGGDTPRSAFTKTQSNMDEIYAMLGATGSPQALPSTLPIAQGGTGNSTGTATKLAPAAILGLVAQSGGVPTGSIVERGSNSNGEYVKFADGTLMCWMNPFGSPSINANTYTAYGPYGTPVSFVNSAFYVHAVTVPNGTNDIYGVVTAYALSSNTVGFVFRNGATAQTFGNTKFFCFGRWF